MANEDLPGLLRIAREAARIAGDVIMPLYASGTPVELKADRTPVTIADRRAEEAMRGFLGSECPDHAVLGEEFGETAGDGPYRWVLDPIDGTQSFIHKVPLFGTLVALERDGEPVLGVIACHAVGETAWAARGLGAFLNGQPCQVSGARELAGATVSMSGIGHTYRMYPEGFARLVAAGPVMRTWGDCYGYLMVAAGRAEVMLDPEMNPWDIAALVPIIREAGGRITSWDGDERVAGSAIATNGHLHEAVVELVASG